LTGYACGVVSPEDSAFPTSPPPWRERIAEGESGGGEVWRYVVSVTTAHKILIATAVLFFFGYALWELRRYFQLGNEGALLRGIGSMVGAIGLGLYLRSFIRSLQK
jgi:hypothetical protein